MADIRNTQEMFADFFGGIVDLGARGVDGLVIARALLRLLIQKGLVTEEEILSTMRDIVQQELGKRNDSPYVLETYREMMERFDQKK